MSEASVRAFFADHAPDVVIIDQGVSVATVVKAATARRTRAHRQDAVAARRRSSGAGL